MSSTDAPPAKKLCTEPAGVIKASETGTPTEPTPSGPVSNPSQAKTDVQADAKEPVDKIKSTVADKTAGHPQQQDNKSQGTDNGVPKVSEKDPANSIGKQGEKKTEGTCPTSGAQKDINKNTPSLSVSGKHNGYNNEPSQKGLIEMDHVDLSKVIEGIQECDLEIEEMTISANQRVMEIEKSLRESKKPVYSKRSTLIQHIPEFWLTTLINHHHISHFINEADEDCLQYLRKLHVEEFDDSVSGFKISFFFDSNPYFENEIICKEISYGPSGVLRSKASPIRWKPGRDLTRVTEAASSSKSQPQSFFHWFIQNANPVQDKIAVFIRDDIWPNPLKYFQVHTEDSTIDVSSDGIMIDSSGEEDEDGSILVLEEDKEEDYYLDDEEDNEDIELLENEEEILDEDFEDDSEDELLLDEDEDFDGEEELQLIEARGIARQRTALKNASLPPEGKETGNVSEGVEKAGNKQTVTGELKQPVPPQPVATQKNETVPPSEKSTEKTATEQTAVTTTEKEKTDAPKQDDS